MPYVLQDYSARQLFPLGRKLSDTSVFFGATDNRKSATSCFLSLILCPSQARFLLRIKSGLRSGDEFTASKLLVFSHYGIDEEFFDKHD